MMLPSTLQDIEEETVLVGDVDRFMRQFESGAYEQEWLRLSQLADRMLKGLMGWGHQIPIIYV